MKKPILILLLLFSFLITHSQSENLFDRDWHIHELSMDGEFIDIPGLPADPPNNCIVGLRFEEIDVNEFIINSSICWINTIFLDELAEASFIVSSWAEFGEGPCWFGSTNNGCQLPPIGNGMLLDFQSTHTNFYDENQSTFTYTIEPPGSGGYETLHIQKPNGDYAIYGEVPPLSLASNILNTYSIYPNPASDDLFLNGKIKEIKSVDIYTLSGQKINTAMSDGKIDVSEMKTGLYFIEITLETGAKQVQKFIKK